MSTFRQDVLPYPTCDAALDGCHLNPGLDPGQRRSHDSWYITNDDVSSGITPNLKLNVDWNYLSSVTGVDLIDANLSIRGKNPTARLFTVLASWRAGEESDNWQPNTPLFFGGSFEIVATVYVTRVSDGAQGGLHWPGSVLASRSFQFSQRGYSFPVEYADFTKRGWPGNALFRTDLDIEGLDHPPEDCLTVYLNEKIRGLYESSRQDIRSARNVFTRVCGGMIFVDVARKVIVNASYENDEAEGLIHIVKNKLGLESERDWNEWQNMAIEDPDEFELRVHSALGLAESLSGYGR